MKSEKVILMLSSNPLGTHSIQLDEEAREIGQKIRETSSPCQIRLETYWAVRADEVLQGINRHKPDIVHFSGHGSKKSELILSSADGTTQKITEDALVSLFDGASFKPQCVVLNSCFSSKQAARIAEHVGIVVGMNEAIGVEAAIIFSGAFYSALGYERSYSEAMRQARSSLLLHGIDESKTPVLFCSPGVDPTQTALSSPNSSGVESGRIRDKAQRVHIETNVQRAKNVITQNADSIKNKF